MLTAILRRTFLYRFLVIFKDRVKVLLFLKGEKLDIRNPYLRIKVPGYLNVFFGYYDIGPFNPSNSDLIIFHANNLKIQNKPEGNVDIILYDLKDQSFSIIGTSNAWNWQQGSRLCWLDEKHICYNIYSTTENEYKAVIYNISNKSSTTSPIPFQSKIDLNSFLSIDYKVLAETRPDYGYFAHEFKPLDFSKGSIRKYDSNSNSIKEIVGVEDVLPHLNISLDGLKYWFNHVLVSPSGERMIFLFRVLMEGKVRHNLFLFDFKSRELKLLLQNVISHYCWKNDDEILYWGRQPNAGYFVYKISDNSNQSILNSYADGHPSFAKDIMYSDTYPMKDRRRRLFSYNFNGETEQVLGYFFEDPKFRYENRCDLHPSISNDKKYIQVDSNYNGQRNIFIISL